MRAIRENILIVFILIIFLGTPLLAADNSSERGISFGLNAGNLNFLGESQPKSPGLLGEASLGLPVTKNFSLNLVSGFGQQIFNPLETDFTTQLLTLDLFGLYNIPLSSSFWPIIYTGVGAINFKRGDWPTFWDAAAIAGGGFDIRLTRRIGLRLAADYRYTTGKDFDGVSSGQPDSYMTAKAGINYSFFKSEKEEPSNGDPLLATDVFALIQKDMSKDFEKKLEASEKSTTLAKQSPTTAKPEETVLERVPVKVEKQRSDADKKKNELDKLLSIRNEILNKLNSELLAKEQRLASLEKELKPSNDKKSNSLYKKPATPKVNYFEADYQLAVEKYYNKDCTDAVPLFENLLLSDPSHKLASNCQYWIGECAYSNKDYESAIAAFEKTLQYPDSHKIDDALIMLGLAYKKINRPDKADIYFVQLLEDYANSEYVSTAKKNLSSTPSSVAYLNGF